MRAYIDTAHSRGRPTHRPMLTGPALILISLLLVIAGVLIGSPPAAASSCALAVKACAKSAAKSSVKLSKTIAQCRAVRGCLPD